MSNGEYQLVCGSCRWFEPDRIDDTSGCYGTCRISAPIPGRDGSAQWPAVNGVIDWCGEHEPNPVLDPGNQKPLRLALVSDIEGGGNNDATK